MRMMEHLAARLMGLQHPCGYWKDFTIHGSSDQWVSAYAGLALAELLPYLGEEGQHDARRAIDKTADFLQEHRHPAGGWGYNARVQPDADSTCIALRFFKAARLDIPKGAAGFLKRHGNPEEGYATYLRDNPRDRWGHPMPEISAAAACALFDTGHLNRDELELLWDKNLRRRQRKIGDWSGIWWTHNAYPTLSMIELAARAGVRPDRDLPMPAPEATQFDIACLLQAYCLLGEVERVNEHLHRLPCLYSEEPLRPGAYLQAPAAMVSRGQGDDYALDAHGIFTLAQIIRFCAAYYACGSRIEAGNISQAFPATVHKPAALGTELFRGVHRTVRPLLDLVAADALEMPYDHLRSVLADGMPLEFSLRLQDSSPSVRFACECGDLYLPPQERLRTQLAHLSRVGSTLGEKASSILERFMPFLNEFPDRAWFLDDPRFLCWLGCEVKQDDPDSFILKAYFNAGLLGKTDTSSQEKVQILMADLDMKGHDYPEFLNEEGNLQEFGLGLRRDGAYGFKLYWEFEGWREDLVRRVLDAYGLEKGGDFPGPHTAAEAKNLPFGIALRLHPEKGFLPDVTLAFKFPPRYSQALNTQDWLERHCQKRNGNRHVIKDFIALFPEHSFHPTLMTVTITPEDVMDTIYLCPAIVVRL